MAAPAPTTLPLGFFRDRTGIPELDRLLRAFERETVEEIDAVEGVPWEMSARWGAHPDNELGNPRVYHLAEPEIAAGMCYAVSLQLCDFLRPHWFDATTSNNNPAEIAAGGYGWCTPEGFGYLDRLVAGFDLHHWAEITHDGRVYGVDFTATQYGYDVWPVVQQLDPAAGRWLRAW